MSNTQSWSKAESDNRYFTKQKGKELEDKFDELVEGIKGNISPQMTTQDLHELPLGIYRAETSGLYNFPDPVAMDIPDEVVADSTVPIGYSILFAKGSDGWSLFQAVKMPEPDLTPINKKIEVAINNGLFIWNDVNTEPTSIYNEIGSSGVTRKMLYDSIRSVKFYNCDSSIPRTLYLIWNGYGNTFQVRTSMYDASTSSWVQEFAFNGSISTINPTKRGMIDIAMTSGNKKCEMTIDTSLIEDYNLSTHLNPLSSEPTYLFSKNCYVQGYDDTALVNSVKTAINNGIFVWQNPNNTPTAIDTPIGTSGITRRMIYNTIRSAKFYNCDSTIPRTLYLIWNGYVNQFQVRTSMYNSSTSSWVEEFNHTSDISVTNPTKKGIVEVKMVSGIKRAEFVIDTTALENWGSLNILVNALSATPELVFSQQCYYIDESTIINNLNVPKTTKLYPNAKLPAISFQFDDIVVEDESVYNLFKTKGTTCGFAYIASPAKINTWKEKYLKWQREGFAILNHSIDNTQFNTTNYTLETARNAIRLAQDRLEQVGFVVNGFVAPSSTYAPELIEALQVNLSYGFTYNDTTPNSRTANPCKLTRISMERNNLTNIKALIDLNIGQDRIITLYGHSANFGNTYNGEVWNLAKLTEVLEYVIAKRSQGLCFLGNTDDCVKYYYEL